HASCSASSFGLNPGPSDVLLPVAHRYLRVRLVGSCHRSFGDPPCCRVDAISIACIGSGLDPRRCLRLRGWIGLDVPPTALAFLGSNEATYGLREGGAGFHRNRPAAGKAKPTLSAGIVRRVRNADGVR